MGPTLPAARAATLAALALILLGTACSDDTPEPQVEPDPLAGIPVSAGLDEVPADTLAMGGLVVDEDGNRLSGVLITTEPFSEELLTNQNGEYILFQNLSEGAYEVRADKAGYAIGWAATVLAEDDFRRLDIVMLPESVASVLTVTPGAAAFPPTRRVATLFLDNPSNDALSWEVTSSPSWLEISSSSREVLAGNPELLDLRVVSSALDLTERQDAVLELRDSAMRRLLIPVVADPIDPSLIRMVDLTDPAARQTSFGEPVSLDFQVNYGSAGVEGELIQCVVRDANTGAEAVLSVDVTLTELADYRGRASCTFTPERNDAGGDSPTMLDLVVEASIPAFADSPAARVDVPVTVR